MRPRLGSLLAVAALLTTAGCGSSTSSTTADDPTSGSSSSGPVSPPGAKVHLLSMTGAGGKPSGTAAPLNTPQQVAAFTRQFRVPALDRRIAAFTAPLRSQGDVEGAVVAVGCDRPPGAAVQVDGSGTVTITPYDVPSPLPECLAPVTTVAIAVIPQG
jgi:hypothetical protein